jgi:hypothetical protein
MGTLGLQLAQRLDELCCESKRWRKEQLENSIDEF